MGVDEAGQNDLPRTIDFDDFPAILLEPGVAQCVFGLTHGDNLATQAALLARAIAAQGQTRYGEASQLIAISQEAAADEDPAAQIIGQGLSARMLADRGRHDEANELAISAVALAAQTDLLSQHADALLDLSHVLAASGRFSQAQAAATQALDLYQRKGNLPGTRESLGYLTRYAQI